MNDGYFPLPENAKRGHGVSIHNVFVDDLCQRIAKERQSSLAMK